MARLAAVALAARRAENRGGGVLRFMVGENGLVLEANLGPNTLDVAAAIDRVDPGAGWALAE
jgi:hypothetical protein